MNDREVILNIITHYPGITTPDIARKCWPTRPVGEWTTGAYRYCRRLEKWGLVKKKLVLRNAGNIVATWYPAEADR